MSADLVHITGGCGREKGHGMWMREKRMSQANVQPDGVRGGVDGRHALVLRLEGERGAISKTKHKLAHTRTVAAP